MGIGFLKGLRTEKVEEEKVTLKFDPHTLTYT